MSLSRRDAKLRSEALRGIGRASARLSGPPFDRRDAFNAVLHNCPRLALRRIELARAHLTKAERALRKWAAR